MELVSAVFNDTEVHFMRGLVRVFKKPIHNGRELHTTYTCDAEEWTRLDPTTGERRAVYWKDLWPDLTGISGPTPSRLSRQFFGFELHRKGTPEELRSAALALIKAIDAALQPAPVAKPDGESVQAVQPAPDANCVTRPDGECVSERPCMHSKQREENKAAVAALPCFICGPVCDPAKHQPQAARYALPASPPCPGCGKPTRECLERPPKYAGCAAWRAPAPEGAKVEHTASRLDGVVGFQLRPPPQELVVLVDDQSEPP